MADDCILITGAAGFIASHCVVALAEAGYNVIAMENSKSTKNFAFQQINKILGWEVKPCRCDMLNYDEIVQIFERYKITTVIHLAAMKGVSESMNYPIECYRNNLVSTLNLLEVMRLYGVKNLIFSSSCAIYGNQVEMPVHETALPRSISNVYGKSKLFIEEILSDLSRSDKEFKITILRYFNPVGAHSSGLIGEDPKRKQISFLTLLGQAALDEKKNLSLFGSSNIRDFVHVMDVAEAHIAAVKSLKSNESFKVFNIGSGIGISLLELIKVFEHINHVKISYTLKERRVGEIEAIIADTTLAETELGWKSNRSVEEMCADSWKWMKYCSNNF
ncbi:UDP-glucose 4-epimerase-like [Chironomus tepperi]|uniref:UDP-glucose 4-epimerase-like n=1 Tax=Chironomus tepperi TaxID=113505 RepID=UPI00391F058A